jgi:hypothetical protein
MALFLEVTKDNRQPIFVRETIHLLMQQGPPVAQCDFSVRGLRPAGCLSFVSLASGLPNSGSPAEVHGYPVQPCGQRCLLADGTGLPCQDQEGGLEGILGVLFIAKHPPADTQNQGAMPPKKHGEGSLVTTLDESAEQFPVVLVAVFGSSENPNVPQHLCQNARTHLRPPMLHFLLNQDGGRRPADTLFRGQLRHTTSRRALAKGRATLTLYTLP